MAPRPLISDDLKSHRNVIKLKIIYFLYLGWGDLKFSINK